jgi:putative transcription factor
MPNVPLPTGQDWDAVNVGKSSTRTKAPKTAREITAAKASGTLATEKRYGAGGNASAHSTTIMSARKLEEADDVGRIAKVDKSLSKAIMQARTAKKMTQKDLATAINEKPQVIGQYESGKAVPNPQIIAKLEKKLGCKLPRPGKSSAPPKTSNVTGSSTSGVAGKSTGVTRGGPPKRR